MKAIKKLALMILMCLLVAPWAGKTAYASSGTIALSDPTAAVGETVSVAVKAGTTSLKLSSYVIKDSQSATIEISKVGSSTVTISGDASANSSALSDDAKTQDSLSTDTVALDTQTEDTTQEESEAAEIVSPPQKDVKVEIAGTAFYCCQITADIIPEGFDYIGYTYEGVAVDALKKDSMILFYLNQVGEEPTILYLYDSSTGGFYVYAPVIADLSYSVISADDSVVIPVGFTATEVSIGGIAVNSWQSDSNSEYYLLYLITSEGEKNLYLYDVVEKTVQRYYYTSDETTATTDDESSYQTMYAELNTKYNDDMHVKANIIYGLIILLVVLLFLVINLTLKLSDKRHPILLEEDDFEDENDIDDEAKQFQDETMANDSDVDEDDDFEIQILDFNDEN
ncbi:MAG: hypothetical protein ACERKZ_02210 [Lachnotalea sp.]